MLDGVVVDDAKVFGRKLQEWENTISTGPTVRGAARPHASDYARKSAAPASPAYVSRTPSPPAGPRAARDVRPRAG